MKKVSIFLILVLCAVAVSAQSVGPIAVVTEEWADATNADGSGLYFDVLRAVFEPAGGQLRIQTMPYTRAVTTVQNKRADIVIGLYEDEADDVIYPTHHIDNDNVSALYLASRFPSFQGEESLSGKNAVWMRGYGYDEYFSVPVRYTEVDRRDVAINMVTAGRADVFLDARADIEAALEEAAVTNADLEIAPIQYLKIYVCFADTPKGNSLATIWDRNFESLLSDGTIEELFSEWEFDEYRP